MPNPDHIEEHYVKRYSGDKKYDKDSNIKGQECLIDYE